jgi:hypothetical protein
VARSGGDQTPARSSSGDIDQLLSSTTAQPAQRSGDEGLPDRLSASQVRAGVGSVTGAVQQCGQGQSGRLVAQMVIDGASGRVTSVTPTGELAGTPVASCVARALRGARFPRFRDSAMTVTYPFTFR